MTGTPELDPAYAGSDTTPGVVWIGPLPPPVHGASLITARFLDRVRERCGTSGVRAVDVGGRGSGVAFHLSRLLAHLHALRVVATLPAGGVVYLSLSGKLGLWYQLPIVALTRLRGLRVVAHHHSYTYVVARARGVALIARLMRRPDDHLFLSAAMRDLFTELYPTAARSTVVSNAHFIEAPTSCPGRVKAEADRSLNLVHVSNLSVAKGTVVAIGVCERLRRRDPGVRLTLVGPCHDPETLAAIEAAGDAVRWVGAQPTEGVYAELDAADLFLFPSSYPNEAEPLVVLEALSRGVPVIATARGALPALLPTDWLIGAVEEEDAASPVAAIAVRVEALTGAPAWRADTARRARERFDACRADVDPVGTVLHGRAPGPGHTRVLQVLPTFDPAFGGPVSAALGVSESYSGVAGVTLTTIGCDEAGAAWDPYRVLSFRGTTSPVGPHHVLMFSWSTLRWLRTHLVEFDLVHVHFNRSLTLIWVPLLARRAGVPYVLQTHGMCGPWRGVLSLADRLFTRPAIRHARAVCVLGPSERDEVLAVDPDAAVVVVHNAVLSPIPAPRGSVERGPRLLFCARLHPRKGLTTFLDVVERLAPRFPGLEGHVVGQDEGALAAARERVVADRLPVTFHGGIDRELVDRWMSTCDVLVHPAPREPFGMSMLEAFAADLPVVAARSSELAGVFLVEGAAMLPADDDLDEWANCVEAVLTDEAVRRRLRAGGRAVLEHHFSRASLTRVLSEVVALSAPGAPGENHEG